MKENSDKRKSGRLVSVILVLAFAGVFCFAAYNLGGELLGAHREKSAFDDLAAIVAQNADKSVQETIPTANVEENGEPAKVEATLPTQESTAPKSSIAPIPTEADAPTATEAIEYGTEAEDASGGDSEALIAEKPEPVEPLPEYVSLYEKNHDFYGWLAIDGTRINYPVMFAPDRHQYYLKRAFDGSRSASGVPFIDDACRPESGYCLVHGHHMRDLSMFGQLPRYAKEDFWKEHPVVRFDSRFEHREYIVAAAFMSRVYPRGQTGVFRYYAYTDLSDPKVFEEYAEQVKKAAIYDTGVKLEYGDELLVLSTCNYHTTDGRFVVVAKRMVDK